MRMCKITMTVPRKLAKTVIDLLVDQAIAFSVEDIDEGSNGGVVLSARNSDSGYGTAKAQGAIKAVLAAMVRGNAYNYKDLIPAVESSGYGATSISPLLSHMTRKGLVRRTGRGKYTLA